MEQTSNDMGYWVFWVIIALSLVLGLFWQALLYRVWGTKVIKEQFTSRVLYLKTKQGEFRFDKVHEKFSYKLKDEQAWSSHDFAEVRSIQISHSCDTASMIEFFLGGWNILDLAHRYRDLVHTYTIQIRCQSSEVIPLMEIKQYEQRDWILAHLYLMACIGILKRLNLYRDAEDVAEQLKTDLSQKIQQTNLTLSH